MTTEKSYAGWYFLGGVILAYVAVLLIDFKQIVPALNLFLQTILKVIPIIFLVFVLMVLTGYFVNHKTLVKYMGKKSGIKGWVITVVAGIISTGPIYMWYPLLSELEKQGVRKGLIAAFLYNRAIKIPLLPMIILYFGIVYTIILTVVMIFVSIIQGLIIEKLVRQEK